MNRPANGRCHIAYTAKRNVRSGNSKHSSIAESYLDGDWVADNLLAQEFEASSQSAATETVADIAVQVC